LAIFDSSFILHPSSFILNFSLMLKLLLLCEYSTLNGGEQSMLSTLSGVRAAGFRPIVACPAEGLLIESLWRRRVEMIPFCCLDWEGNRRPLAELREELAGLLGFIAPDLFHANSLAMGRLSGPVAAELGVPSIAHLRDIIKLGPQAIKDLNCHRRLLAVSAATREYHVAQGLEAEKCFVLFNGVDLERFRPRSPTGFLHEELHLLPEARLIAAIGQLGLRKGQEVFVQAAEMIAERWPDVHFLLVGERCSSKSESYEFEAALHAAACGHLAGRLHFLGFRPRIELLLGELTLLVHAARQEPLGRVLLEAGAAGVPIIATNVGGTSEIFPPESEAAVLVPPDDPEAIATVMEQLLQDDEKRRRLGMAARRRMEVAFDVRSAVENLLSHYQAIV
jgi:glycosyltransferase involved in cell wall biosynthesis